MEDRDEDLRRQQLINFGHTQWGFNHWSWTVTKQDLDFVDFSNGKYTAGVAAFVSVVVRSIDIQRQNVGYATCSATAKGSAIHRARKCAVTNALRESLLSFGGSIATDLQELLAQQKHREQNHTDTENNQNIPNKIENNPANKMKKEHPDVGISNLKNIPPVTLTNAATTNINNSNVNNGPSNSNSSNASNVPPNVLTRPHTAPVKAAIPPPPPMAKALPMPVNLPRPPLPRHQPPRPNPNELQPLPAVSVPPSAASANEEEARAERKRRQKQAQEEFRLKQLLGKNPAGQDDSKDKSCSIDSLLMEIPTQDIMIEQSGSTNAGGGDGACNASKRKSPDSRDAKRRGVFNRLDIVTD